MRGVAHLAPIHLGLDVHKDTISVGILDSDQQVPDVERITHDEPSVRRLVARFPDRARLRACYEAGPTGFELARLLHSLDVRCEVIAPSLIPKAPGDKVKTDKRDCRRLARLHRAGELVAIRVPTLAEEAVRDLCRTRSDMVEDLTRARNRLGKFLLRHGRPWRGGSTRTKVYQAWLRVVPMCEQVRQAIGRQLLAGARPDDLVFPGPGGSNGIPRRPHPAVHPQPTPRLQDHSRRRRRGPGAPGAARPA